MVHHFANFPGKPVLRAPIQVYILAYSYSILARNPLKDFPQCRNISAWPFYQQSCIFPTNMWHAAISFQSLPLPLPLPLPAACNTSIILRLRSTGSSWFLFHFSYYILVVFLFILLLLSKHCQLGIKKSLNQLMQCADLPRGCRAHCPSPIVRGAAVPFSSWFLVVLFQHLRVPPGALFLAAFCLRPLSWLLASLTSSNWLRLLLLPEMISSLRIKYTALHMVNYRELSPKDTLIPLETENDASNLLTNIIPTTMVPLMA